MWVGGFAFGFGLQETPFIRQQVDFYKGTTGTCRGLKVSGFNQGDKEPFCFLLIFHWEPKTTNVALREVCLAVVFRVLVQFWIDGSYNISPSFIKLKKRKEVDFKGNNVSFLFTDKLLLHINSRFELSEFKAWETFISGAHLFYSCYYRAGPVGQM